MFIRAKSSHPRTVPSTNWNNLWSTHPPAHLFCCCCSFNTFVRLCACVCMFGHVRELMLGYRILMIARRNKKNWKAKMQTVQIHKRFAYYILYKTIRPLEAVHAKPNKDKHTTNNKINEKRTGSWSIVFNN